MNEDNTRRFTELLHRTIGLDAESIGTNAVMRAVRERFDASRAVTLDDYYHAVSNDPALMQELIEAVVVPETWFFRDPEVYTALARLARIRLSERPSNKVRVLSLPCSMGEEAYSVAMALSDAGIAADRFVIEAIDVSERALSHARRAHYGRNAFRGRALGFRDRHFRATEDGWQLDERMARCVRFTQANLFQLDARMFERFDFILCRNVLIYFDRETQSAALRVLDSLLADGGMLFIGPAETGLLMREGMSPANIPLAFAFRRPEREIVNAAPPIKPAASGEFVMPAWARGATRVDSSKVSVSKPMAFAAPAMALHRTSTPVSVNPALAPASTPTPTSTPTLAQAHALADAGSLIEAESIARGWLHKHPASADAYYLLGVIADARNAHDESRAHYRRALYLDPTHREALTHLAALLQLDGDTDRARIMLARAERSAESAR
ncbi:MULTISPECIES: CheR family methyltransferase [unclassified Caballeronia]|uniref:CheR family methyltransferase n=1 Tax=unclassified Caballeronia TaxID=2646786 RepID=UPI002862FA8C|nr:MULTISPECIES: CheR family methyltransferase [unclassified Caballeronia]MDR5775967.1 CheR family methyltransferase [Caballeronia sp. LZ002]MDR5851406.1 CheR family methyltransferase [Caballeronia sp. LZ003]